MLELNYKVSSFDMCVCMHSMFNVYSTQHHDVVSSYVPYRIEDSLVASTPVSTELAAFHLEAILATSSQMHDVSVCLAEKSMKSRVESGVTEAYPWGMGSGGLDSTAT